MHLAIVDKQVPPLRSLRCATVGMTKLYVCLKAKSLGRDSELELARVRVSEPLPEVFLPTLGQGRNL
jgi:hypothetical protein